MTVLVQKLIESILLNECIIAENVDYHLSSGSGRIANPESPAAVPHILDFYFFLRPPEQGLCMR